MLHQQSLSMGTYCACFRRYLHIQLNGLNHYNIFVRVTVDNTHRIHFIIVRGMRPLPAGICLYNIIMYCNEAENLLIGHLNKLGEAHI